MYKAKLRIGLMLQAGGKFPGFKQVTYVPNYSAIKLTYTVYQPRFTNSLIAG
jgi:hypothetical protein